MSDMSRTPDSDICMVRGMGVADSVSTSMDSRKFLQPLFVLHAEALLLVDDDQPQIVRVHVAARAAGACPRAPARRLWRSPRASAFCCSGVRKRESTSTVTPEGVEALSLKEVVVLPGQNGGGHQYGTLFAVHHALERRPDGHLGLAEAHIAAEQPVHGLGTLHIVLDHHRCSGAGRRSRS